MNKKLLCVQFELFDKDGRLIDRRKSGSFLSDTLDPGKRKEVLVTWDNAPKIVQYYSKYTGYGAPFSLYQKKRKNYLELQWNVFFVDDPLKNLKQCSDPLELKFVMSVQETKPASLKALFSMDFDYAIRYLKEYMDNIKE